MKIAICIPTYNRAKTIFKTLNSVVNQLEENMELIVFDNKSTDETVNIVKEAFGDKVKLHINNKNLGYVGNINRCLSLANKFDWIAILHSDDFHIENSFKYFMPFLSKYRDAGIIYSNLNLIDENDNISEICFDIEKEIVYLKGYHAIMSFNERQIPCSGTIYNSKAIKEVGLFSDKYPYSADEEYCCRIAAKYDIIQIPKVIGFYRLHKDNLQIKTWLEKDFFNNFFNMREEMLNYTEINPADVNRILKNSKAILSHAISVRLAKEGYWVKAISYNFKSFLSSKIFYFNLNNLIKSIYVLASVIIPTKLNHFIVISFSKKI